MKILTAMVLSALMLLTHAQETDEREWTSSVGSKITGRATAFDGGTVTLVTDKGRELSLPIERLSSADQDFLREHFEVEEEEVKAPEGLPIAVGATVGPIKAAEGSHYYIYLPKTLVPGGKAPLMFWTGSGPGHERTLNHYKKAADIIGAVLACSKEARNQKDGFRINHNHTKACLKHISETLPVDVTRVIFSGGSGGGATSLYNASKLPCLGAIPFIGYIPDGSNPPKKGFYYYGNGARDYNRYTSAHAVKKYGKRATHRIYPGGHTITGWEPAEDGLLWVYSRHLFEKESEFSQEAKVFKSRFLKWLRELSATKPHESYYWTDHLLNTCSVDGSFKTEVEKFHRELAENPIAVSYLEGRQEIEKFSDRHLSDKGTGSKKGHTTKGIVKAAEKLQKKYEGIADLGTIFTDLGLKTN